MASTQNLYQCRLCLKRTPTRVNIFGGDFPKMLEILTSIKVQENDGLPKNCCVKCSLDVKSALVTKRRIIKAHKYLIERLNKRNIPSTSNQKATMNTQSSNKPRKDAATKCPAVVYVNENSSDSQNSEKLCEYSASKIEIKEEILDESQNLAPNVDIKVEVLDDCQSSDGASIADEQNDGSTNESESTVKRKATGAKNSYTCKACNLSFTKRYNYIRHCEEHKKTNCPICNQVLRSSSFKQHLVVHAESDPLVCKFCGALYKDVSSLRAHKYFQHSNRNAYICEECGAEFKTNGRLLLHHQAKSHGIRNFKCETCGKAFYTEQLLMKHERTTHKKPGPHVCEFCGTRFSSQDALNAHKKRKHPNEKPFVCDQCDERFSQKVSLRSHLKSKHGIEEAKEFICSECGERFSTDFVLGVHQRLHTSMKCKICSKSFADQEYLDNHMKEAHGDVKEDGSQDSEQDHGES